MDFKYAGTIEVSDSCVWFARGDANALTASDVVEILDSYAKEKWPFEESKSAALVNTIAQEAPNMNSEEISITLSRMVLLGMQPGEARAPLRSAVLREVDNMNSKQFYTTCWGVSNFSMDLADMVPAIVREAGVELCTWACITIALEYRT